MVKVKRKVIAVNSYQVKIRYGHWVCYCYDSGQAEWKWEPIKP